MTQQNENNQWPKPKFYFTVLIDGGEYSFQEVTGLETEADLVDYRQGDSKTFSTIKMPGLAKFGNITLKKGLFAKDNDFFKWYSDIKMNTIRRSTIIIKLVDEQGKPTITWTLQNAWPIKITGNDLKSDGNEVAVESLEIAHEGITILT